MQLSVYYYCPNRWNWVYEQPWTMCSSFDACLAFLSGRGQYF